MIAWIRGPVVWGIGALAVLSVGLSTVPIARRLASNADIVHAAPEMQAVEQPEAPDLAPILGFAPFGSPAAPQEGPEASGETGLGLVLLGVTVAVPSTASRAIIGGGDVAVASYAVGDRITATARLAEVHPDRIVLDVDGRLETLSFPTLGAQAATSVPQVAPPEGGPDLRNLIPREDEASEAADPSFDSADGDSLNGLETDPDALLADYMGQFEEDAEGLLNRLGIVPADGGYRIVDGAAPAVRQAGLQPGDLVTGVNGQKVGDMVDDQVYFREVAAAGRARVEILREGQTVVLTFPLR